MRIAVLGDIHGNINALKKATENAEKQGVDFILSTGDLVDTEENAFEIMSFCKIKKILSVRGNHDDMVGYSKKIDKEIREYYQNLPFDIELKVHNRKIKIFHGSKKRIEEYIFEDSEIFNEYLEDSLENDIIICGHTHIAHISEKNNVYVINPGSISLPHKSGHEPTYLIMNIFENQFSAQLIKF